MVKYLNTMHLKIFIQNQKPIIHQLQEGTFSVGRSLKCDIHIAHESVSRRHFTLIIENGKPWIIDHGGVNGTRIDSKKVASEEKIEWPTFFPLQIGSTIEIQFVREGTSILNVKDFEEKKIYAKKQENKKQLKSFQTKKIEEKKKGKSLPSFLVVLSLCILGYWGYVDFKSAPSHSKIQTLPMNKKSLSPEIMASIPVLDKESTCLNELQMICQSLQLKLDFGEGALLNKNKTFIFLNLKKRLIESELKKSFLSILDKDEQIIKILIYNVLMEIFNELKNLNTSEFYLIDSDHSSEPKHILSFENTFFKKYKKRDFDIMFNELEKNRPEMFDHHVKKNINFYSL